MTQTTRVDQVAVFVAVPAGAVDVLRAYDAHSFVRTFLAHVPDGGADPFARFVADVIALIPPDGELVAAGYGVPADELVAALARLGVTFP